MTASPAAALAGLKVVDFTWALVGPTSTRVLADFGATVVHVETATRTDPARTAPPFLDSAPGPERSAGFATFNAGKLGVTLNLGSPAGHQLFLRLVRWADALVESFTPGVMPALKLEYETLRETNPALVMLSTCLHGQTGPEARRSGYGVQGAGQAGFTGFLGWPDRPPALPGAYTDFVASRMVTLALLAGVEHRRRTGKGQHIDLSQIEASLQFLAPAILDYSANGRVAVRMGNREAGAVPHGVFPCLGDDSWVAVAVQTTPQWLALCRLLGRFEWASSSELEDASARQVLESEIEGAVRVWSSERTADEAERALQEAGIPASAVHKEVELGRDAQLQSRGLFQAVDHRTLGRVTIEGPRVLLSRTPGSVRGVPILGGDNAFVLGQLLELTDEEIAEAAAAGALD